MRAKHVFSKYNVPQKDEFFSNIANTIKILRNENPILRPPDETGLPGAFLDISSYNSSIPVVLVPDLHARLDFFNEILNFSFCFDDLDTTELTIKEALVQGKVIVVCLGDGLHSERRGFERWLLAQDQWLNGKTLNKYMCEEMEEGLGLMSSIMNIKQECPNHFHFLKGNHENILNDHTCGNLPFRKFAAEGEMVKDFMLGLYGKEITHAYDDFEHNLPLFVKGANFLASHAEPIQAFSKNDLVNAYLEESTVLGLTWTHTDEADENAVHFMLNDLLMNNENAVYFAGHRTVSGTHRALHKGRFIQIHNPNEHYITIVNQKKDFNSLTDIFDTKTGKNVEV